MKTLEKGQEKIERICSILREETLEPAKRQAEGLIKEGERQAEVLIAEAELAAAAMIKEAQARIEQERQVFQSSLEQAAKQSLESLRQDIECRFFSERLKELVVNGSVNPDLVAKLISAIVTALEKEGLGADLTALIPHTITPNEVNSLLLDGVLKTLKEKSVTIGKFAGGAQVKINNKNMTIDISEEALKELLASFVVRKDFRKMVFGA